MLNIAMKKFIIIILIFAFCLGKANTNKAKNKYASEEYPTVEDRKKRGNWHNFKEYMLLKCFYNLFTDSPVARKDIEDTLKYYMKWTNFGINSVIITKKNEELITKYLSKEYLGHSDNFENPPKLHVLKCIDLYNSRELDDYIKKYIPKN